MYSRNLFNFLKPALPKGELAIDWNDEVFAGAVLTHDGQIKHEAARAAVEGQKT
jgi:NAD(P) transhydrogenase subunit alpha